VVGARLADRVGLPPPLAAQMQAYAITIPAYRARLSVNRPIYSIGVVAQAAAGNAKDSSFPEVTSG